MMKWVKSIINRFRKKDIYEKKLFDTIEDAVIDFAIKYNSTSIIRSKELGTRVCRKKTRSGTKYYYKRPFKGFYKSIILLALPALRFWKVVATIHTHGSYHPSYANNSFSQEDKRFLLYQGLVFVVTPNGSVRRYNGIEDKIIFDKAPSDFNDKTNNGVPITNEYRVRPFWWFW